MFTTAHAWQSQKWVTTPLGQANMLVSKMLRCNAFRCYNNKGSQDSMLVQHQSHDQNVASLNPGRGSRRIFFSRVNFWCLLLFGVRSTPVLPQWYVNDPGHSAKSAGGKLHLNKLTTPLTQWSQNGLTMPLCRHSVGTYQETSSHATRQGTLSHSHLSLLSHSDWP